MERIRFVAWLRAALFVLLLALGPTAWPAAAQDEGTAPVPGLQRNGVAPLEARGDSLFIGPCLNLGADGQTTVQTFVQSERLCGDAPNSVFSLDAEADVIVAGLGREAPGAGSAAAGFLFSEDGGASFAFAPPQLDAGVPADTTVRYGVNAGPRALPALPVVVPEESTPFAVDYVDSTGAVWVAGRASGLRRAPEGLGRQGAGGFERVVLPPDSLDAISPTQYYGFALRPKRGSNAANPGQFNHIVLSVLVDETGTVWAGTLAGINRSRPTDVFTFEVAETGARFSDRAWRRFGFANTADAGEGLSGDIVPVLAEQTLPGQRNPIWMVTRRAVTEAVGQERGATFTRDGGSTFYQTLLGEEINDLAFRGETAYAASERGLFVSTARADTGYAWRLEQRFRGAEIPDAAIAKRRRVLSVATTRSALWAGTEDGLLKSTDGGETWTISRTRVPARPEQPTEAVPEAETYAYPNPFSPVAAPAGVVRIVFEATGGATATVQIYDFAMDPVRQVTGACDADGRCEVAWDGTDRSGGRVANGVYFYEIEAGGETERGKIMVAE